MTEPIWLARADVDAIHSRQLARFGGQYGIRDDTAIESALARPQQKWHYAEERDIIPLAASYAFGFTRNHGYVDGNKRVGFVAMAIFLDLNEWELEVDEADVIRTMLALADGRLSESELATWVQTHVRPLDSRQAVATNA